MAPFQKPFFFLPPNILNDLIKLIFTERLIMTAA